MLFAVLNQPDCLLQVQLPVSAFISDFTLWLGADHYNSEVLSKEEAKEQFETARNNSQAAGLVTSQGQTQYMDLNEGIHKMEIFRIQVSIPGNTHARFVLTYQELLTRHRSIYTHRISVRPGQIVRDFNVTVFAYEPQGFRHFDVAEMPGLLDSSQTGLIAINGLDQYRTLVYTPSVDEQRELYGAEGISGDLVIEYDVNRGQGGSVYTEDGYFVHHLAPDGLPTVGKHVMFVIDCSGSMQGDKLQQAQDALLDILDELHPQDRFHLLFFAERLTHWPPVHLNQDLVPASAENVRDAKAFIAENMVADGGTDMNDALITAIYTLKIDVSKTLCDTLNLTHNYKWFKL